MKIYDRSGYGRLSPEDFCRAACQTLALSKEYALEVFDQVDRNQLGYITFGKNLVIILIYAQNIFFSQIKQILIEYKIHFSAK
ncbi:hypothetical protein NQ314_007671 [Rhamnusium bicolor]|uniref:EF-hand domain-containing protein n=1 Tax=Rhamnusium bicolor TaxID=1586634 RepID=A0AAV8YJC1_9CUCU|nr:hypothetical protein NQ314_007671 [Rhamnusium bicolor]